MKKIWGFGSACVDIRICTADYGPGYTAKLLARERTFSRMAASNC